MEGRSSRNVISITCTIPKSSWKKALQKHFYYFYLSQVLFSNLPRTLTHPMNIPIMCSGTILQSEKYRGKESLNSWNSNLFVNKKINVAYSRVLLWSRKRSGQSIAYLTYSFIFQVPTRISFLLQNIFWLPKHMCTNNMVSLIFLYYNDHLCSFFPIWCKVYSHFSNSESLSCSYDIDQIINACAYCSFLAYFCHFS